jgi:hypothetical protein
MAYKTAFRDDSDADDEYERSVIQSPTLPGEYSESSPTDSNPHSTEHTPTTFTHSRDSKGSPTGVISEWTEDQASQFVREIGLEQYAENFYSRCCLCSTLDSTNSLCNRRGNCWRLADSTAACRPQRDRCEQCGTPVDHSKSRL